MSVSARFYVQSVKKYAYPPNAWADPAPRIDVELAPVNGNRGEENKAWASATPSGTIKMTVGNPAAAEWFERMLGRDVAITFDEATDTADS